MSDLIEIPAPSASRSSRPLEALFRAQLRVEIWEDRRRWVARLIIGLSLPMAYFVWGADRPAATGARLVCLVWAFTFAGWCFASVGLMVARRAVEALVALAGGRRVRAERERDADR